MPFPSTDSPIRLDPALTAYFPTNPQARSTQPCNCAFFVANLNAKTDEYSVNFS